ncbi:adenosine deaminase [Pacificibacter marinus]|uniref:Adenine deaminase n=1 Tax=Pacificibacter marinus TaxID=658057 RepID=A0A1Y5TAP9_9RHOB|nr:adenosine deaminase [Pacificibacter marinus]SEL21526.1 adenosine deaminase [Pacificibacter marinus]SLN56081.1 Adenine deaminase [Pacificibacter marinus]
MIDISTDFFRRLPKAELHLHLEGSIRPETAFELAQKNGVALLKPGQDLADLYDYDDLAKFLNAYTAIAGVVLSADDFHRVTYEMLEDCAVSGARHVEFFISPHAHDVSFDVQFRGIRRGMAEARDALGISCFMAPGINRELGPEAAEVYFDTCAQLGGDDMAGVGLDYFEAPYPPDPFAPLYDRARAAGYQVTAHAGEGGPAAYVAGAMDALGCRRIDHGYAVMDDPALVARCREAQILFTCCPSTTKYTTHWRDLTDPDHPIRKMKEAGLNVTINSDDPPFFFTTLAQEYEIAYRDMGFTLADIKASILQGIQGSWLSQDQRVALAKNWAVEIDDLIATYVG